MAHGTRNKQISPLKRTKTSGIQPKLNVACFVQSCLTDADFVLFSNYCLIGTRQTGRLFFAHRTAPADILDQRKGGAAYVSWQRGRRLLDTGRLRGGAGRGHPHCRHFSRGGAAVPGGVFADRVRLRLLQALERSCHMNIVVWKSPKALRGILRRLFKIKA